MVALAEGLLDPDTQRRIEALGIREGFHCFEPGCGGGSIALWLCNRVGPTGRVVALDLDTRFVRTLSAPNLEVREEDLTLWSIPEQAFDLVHVRLVLQHLPRREEVITRLVSALKPGGVLLLEDQDAFSLSESPYPLVRRTWGVLASLARARGADLAFGRRMPLLMRRSGLVDVGTEVSSSLTPGRSPTTELWSLTLQHLRPALVGAGLLSLADMEAVLALFADPNAWFYGPVTVAAWGRRPL